ncbi:endoplasmic reticulum protein SC65-like [Aplochiton taeniatus]
MESNVRQQLSSSIKTPDTTKWFTSPPRMKTKGEQQLFMISAKYETKLFLIFNEIMEDFERRTPYRYLHFAHFHMNNLQRAVPCAYTYLQRNPDDSEMSQQMKTYQSQYDLEGYLLDYEERPHQVTFLKAVTLLNIEDLSGGLGHMEQALSQYLQEYDLCQAVCEGAMEVSLVKNLYPCPADAYVDALRCKVKCEDNLKPNVGGFFVEQFVATMYHYLQYAYYKLNDVRSAAPCASSFTLFHPEDEVMKQNVLYYQSYTQQYGLNNTHFKPRTEAVKYHDQIATQRQMLLQAEDYLRMNDEYFLGPQEAVVDVADSLDIEFEGLGDYEEAFYAKWWQPKGKGDIGNSEI